MKDQKKAGVLLSYLTIVVNVVIQFSYTPIMLRLLGQSEYGVYTLSNSIINYLMLFDMGFAGSYLRFFSIYKMNNDDDSIKKLNGTFATLFSIMSLLALICGLALSFQIEKIFNKSLSIGELYKAKVIMIILSFSLALNLLTNVFSSVIIAYERFFRLKFVKFLSTLVSPLIGIPLMLMGYGSISLALATLITSIWCCIDYGRYCNKTLGIKFHFKLTSKDLIFELGRFSFFIFLNEIISQVNWSVDKVLLGYYYGSTVTAIYGVGSQIDSVYRTVSCSISSVFVPQINRLVAEGSNDKELTNLFCRIGRLQWILLAPILLGFIGFGRFFVRIWAGYEYSASFYVALLLIVPVSVPLIQNIGIEIQRAKNKHQFRSLIYSLMAIVNILISIPLGKLYGAIGCAMGTSVSLIIGNGIIMNWFYQKKLNLKIFLFWKEILSLSKGMIPSVLYVVLLAVFPIEWTMIKFVIYVILFFFIYGLFMWIYGFNNNEKKLFLHYLNGICKGCMVYDRDKK